jgi:hypothetical protein
MKYLLLSLLVLGACHNKGPAAPTADESAQLNDAENMLDAAANEEGPADRSTSPSNNSD